MPCGPRARRLSPSAPNVNIIMYRIRATLTRIAIRVAVFALGVQLIIGSAVQVAVIGMCFSVVALASALGAFTPRDR